VKKWEMQWEGVGAEVGEPTWRGGNSGESTGLTKPGKGLGSGEKCDKVVEGEVLIWLRNRATVGQRNKRWRGRGG